MNARMTFLAVTTALALSQSAMAQSSTAGSPDETKFQIDVGYFNLKADTVLNYTGPTGGSGQVSFEKDLGQDQVVNTFWVDSTWRVGRRHTLKLSYTQLSRENPAKTLERDFVWGGQTYNAGLTASSTSGAQVLGGYYRFAIVRNDQFEIGPSLGVGHLTLDAGIKATGTVGGQSRSLDRSTSLGAITGAIGAYTTARPAKNLALHADFLYIKVTLDKETASVTDWRLAADYYFSRHIGVGAQYKYNNYSMARGVLSTELGGELTFQGSQVFLTFRF
jgi:hypothetical protein